MDLEAPADAWYVFVAVAIISLALTGLTVGVSTGPPPDAPEAANTIEAVTASEYPASASYEHDADVVTIDRETITMTNDDGTTHARFSYGIVVPVNGDERLENLVYGASFADEYESELRDGDEHAFAAFEDDVVTAFEKNTGTALRSSDDLRVRGLTVDAGIDELDPLEERMTVEVTDEWEPIINSLPEEIWDPDPYIGEVRVTYTGVENRYVTVHANGEYRLSDLLPDLIPDSLSPDSEPLDETVHLVANDRGVGSILIAPRSEGGIDYDIPGTEYRVSSSQPARDPIEFTIQVTDPDGELPKETWELELTYDDGSKTWVNEIEREPTFDDGHPAIEHTDEGYYHVTLVVV